MVAKKAYLSSISILALIIAVPAVAQQALPEIEIGATPLRSEARSTPHTEAAPAVGESAPAPAYVSPLVSYQIPASVHVVSEKEIENTRKFDLGGALQRTAPGVIINDAAGNPFAPEINYRGFNSSPLAGVPQGLAVYQNGVRINESWGDTVNWDLIPNIAVGRVAIETGNPLYGLNAIGGAIVLDMKNGFTWQGFEVDARGGSFGRKLGTVQYGKQSGNFAVYGAAEAMGDQGYRNFSGSNIKRFYGDVGYKAEQGEIHANVSLAQNYIGASGPTPVDLANVAKNTVYTTPQTYKNSLAMVDLNGQVQVSPTWNLMGDVHFRSFNQARRDGNTTEFECDPDQQFCTNDVGQPTNVPNFFFGNGARPVLAAIDSTSTNTRTLGGTVQVNNTDRILGFANKFTLGVNFEHGWTGFQANEQLGTLNPVDLSVQSFNYFVDAPDSGIAPVNMTAANSYLGVYALNSLDLTDKLTVTGGMRFNNAVINVYDLRGTALNGGGTFNRVNPLGGITYKILPSLAAYASYSEANRAPTPLELGCADPNRPCVIDNFMVSDPPLKQVTSNTIETGLRGDLRPREILADTLGFLSGTFQWSAGLFRTNAFNDILSVPSNITGRGYFVNAGNTVRQGAELALRYNDERASAYINYTLTDAFFNSTQIIGSPFNPLAIALGTGSIMVTPGATLPSVAKHRFKTGVDYAVTPKWKVGGDLVYASGGYVRGDEINAFGTLPSYAMLNLRTSYNLLQNMQIYAVIENATNTRARSFGAFFDTTALPFLNFTNPRMVSVSPPTAFYAGMKWDFGANPTVNDWTALAAGHYNSETGHKEASAPRIWQGPYAGLNAGYGWGANTGVMTRGYSISDRFAQVANANFEETPEGVETVPFAYGAMSAANTGQAQVNRHGFVGGGQIGYNYQDESNVVLGVETDMQGTIFRGNGNYLGAAFNSASTIEEDAPDEFLTFNRRSVGTGTISSSVNWLGTTRVRLGYAVSNKLLLFAAGGLAYGGVSASATNYAADYLDRMTNGQLNPSSCNRTSGCLVNPVNNTVVPGAGSMSTTRVGWAAGGGGEWMFADNWSLKAEALYYNLGNETLVSSPVSSLCGAGFTGRRACAKGDTSVTRSGALLWSTAPESRIQFDGVIARAGINYHFDWEPTLLKAAF